MSTERKHRHVLDELLARSVQVPRASDRRGTRPAGDSVTAPSGWEPQGDEEETPTVWAPGPRPVSTNAGPGEDAVAAEDPGGRPVDTVPAEDTVQAEQRPEPRSLIIRDARRPERPLERRPARSQGEVQVGRGPLELHLSRAASEERLAETGERLGRTERSLKDARERLSETERHLEEARARLAQSEGRLAEARKHVLASEERLAMTEASERHAREEQARAEQSSQALATQLPVLRERERALAEELRSERGARVEAELELARLRGSLLLLSPVVKGIEQATSAISRDAAEHDQTAGAPGAAPTATSPGGLGADARPEQHAPAAAPRPHVPPPAAPPAGPASARGLGAGAPWPPSAPSQWEPRPETPRPETGYAESAADPATGEDSTASRSNDAV